MTIKEKICALQTVESLLETVDHEIDSLTSEYKRCAELGVEDPWYAIRAAEYKANIDGHTAVKKMLEKWAVGV